MEFLGLPLHPLVVHAAVVFGPVAALAAVVYAVVPRWRWATRWPSLALSTLALASVVLAYFSGKSYLAANAALEQLSAVQIHEKRGEILLWVALGFAAVSLASVAVLGGPSPLVSGGGAREARSVGLERLVLALVVLAALLLLVLVLLTGDAGSRAVWG